MDAVVILMIALISFLRIGTTVTKENIEAELPHQQMQQDKGNRKERVVKTNDAYYKDETAFTSISSALGFPKEDI